MKIKILIRYITKLLNTIVFSFKIKSFNIPRILAEEASANQAKIELLGYKNSIPVYKRIQKILKL